jgi:hypothetical protein
MRRSRLLSLALILISITAFAQKGKLTGKVVDGETGEELIGATVIVEENGQGALTDLYGTYTLELEPGTYTLNISYVSFAAQKVEHVEINPGNTVELNVPMSSDTQLEEIIIQAEAIKDNDVALLKIQKKALAVQDGISSSEISKIGASNAAESMTQVTGASIEGGKYVVMRGLGDRYSITQMNDITLPSADPYRNSTSLDMIPSDMVESITTVKTFTADQPGNFTGGKVNVVTKSIPSDFYLTAKISTTYNTQSSYINDFLFDQAANNQLWGFDNGVRSLPAVLKENVDYLKNGEAENTMFKGRVPENSTERNIIDESARSLSNSFLPEAGSTFGNTSFELAVGGQSSLGGKPLGINVGVNWGHGFEHRGNKKLGLYSGVADGLIKEQDINGVQSIEAAELGGMLGLSYQFSPNNEITYNLLYHHSGETTGDESGGYWRNTASDNYQNKYVLHRERSLLNNQLIGKHNFPALKNARLEWVAGYAQLTQDEPDYRQFGYVVNQINGEPQYVMNKSEVGRLPTHFYRFLEDEQLNGQVDFTLPLSESSDNLIKVGYSYSAKDRSFDEFQYSHFREPVQRQPGVNDNYVDFAQANGDLERYFDVNQNYGVVGGPATNTLNGRTEYGFGNYYADLTVVGNIYTGREEIHGGYLMGVVQPTAKLKTILGLRLESTNMETVSADSTKTSFGKVDEDGNPILESRNGNINIINWLPTINLIYALTDQTNLRLAASRTVARPNMREISPFASLSSLHEPTVLGNKDLQVTNVTNVDLRYEIYPKPGELFAVSAYYKDFRDPIVWQLTPKASTPEIQPINVNQATVFGFEVELRKNLDFLSPALQNFQFGTNLSYIYSRVEKSAEEMEAVINAGRTDIEDWRPFQGQSPYIINLRLSYLAPKLNWDHTLAFNIWGKRLSFITGALDPDVYEQSRPSLDYVMTKGFGEKWILGFKAMNILNMKYKQLFDYSDGTDSEFIYESFQRGINFNVSVAYRL